ncbi:TPA: hypothetical protein DIV49_00240 [Candidatus Saccharibacteria bacterium]|nr:hypothetical protein [Candidatus Saccharibacteria bacterium]HRJ90809.1 hypothetical protein [Candidatus Saccharibacteria bacterium]
MTELRNEAPQTKEITDETIAEIESALARVAVRERFDPIIVQAEVSKSGKVIRPAIDIANGTLANGQDISVFYERGRADKEPETYYDKPSRSESALMEARRIAGR